MSQAIAGMPTGLYVSWPAPYGQPAQKPLPRVVIVQSTVPAGSLIIPVRSEYGTYLIPHGAMLRFGTTPVLVTETIEVRSNGTRGVKVLDPHSPDSGVSVTLGAGTRGHWNSLYRVLGTSDSDLQLSEVTQEATSVVHSGHPSPVWAERVITSKNWTLPRRGRYRPADMAYQAIRQAALEDREVWVERVLPSENGNPAEVESGRALITGFGKTAPADGVIDAAWVFTGQGPLSMAEPPVATTGVMLDFSKPGNTINLTFV